MKKTAVLLIILTLLLLCACSAHNSQTMEYVTDEIEPVSQPQEISFALPLNAVQTATSTDGSAVLYTQSEGEYEILTQITPCTQIQQMIPTLTGYPAEQITWIETQQQNVPHFQFAWASASDAGETVSRACVIQKEDYCYSLVFTAPTGLGDKYQACMQDIFSSFCVR